MPERDFIIWLDDRTYVRIEFLTVRGQVVSFVARLMVVNDDRHDNVVRYDTAHGMAHRDILDHRGRVIRKDWLFEMPFDEALTYAKNDLVSNYERYCQAYETR